MGRPGGNSYREVSQETTRGPAAAGAPPGTGSRHADETVVALLAELVAVEELEIPAEALESHDGPPLTSDDLLDLVLALERHAAAGSTAASARAF